MSRARVLLVALLLGGCSGSAHSLGAGSGTASLSWDAPTTNADGTSLTDLAGFKIGYGAASHSYSMVIDVGNVTSYQVTMLGAGRVYFAVKAYDTSGNESEYCEEASKDIK